LHNFMPTNQQPNIYILILKFASNHSLTNTVITGAAVDSTWRPKDSAGGTVLEFYCDCVN